MYHPHAGLRPMLTNPASDGPRGGGARPQAPRGPNPTGQKTQDGKARDGHGGGSGAARRQNRLDGKAGRHFSRTPRYCPRIRALTATKKVPAFPK